MKNIIHIFGASGAGTSTLGRAINNKYGHTWLDTADSTQKSYAMHNEWKQNLTCPVLVLDGTRPIEKLLKEIKYE